MPFGKPAFPLTSILRHDLPVRMRLGRKPPVWCLLLAGILLLAGMAYTTYNHHKSRLFLR